MTDVLDRMDDDTSLRNDARSKLKIIDCDIHPSLRSREDLFPFLEKRWQDHLRTYGAHIRNPGAAQAHSAVILTRCAQAAGPAVPAPAVPCNLTL